MSKDRLNELRHFHTSILLPSILASYRRCPGARPWTDLARALVTTARRGTGLYLWPALLSDFLAAGETLPSRTWLAVRTRATAARLYLFHHSRPARHWRAKASRRQSDQKATGAKNP